MVTRKGLYRALKNMVTWTMQGQIKNSDCFEAMATYSLKEYAKQFCTIKFSLPRQSGHTTLAIKLYKNMFKRPILIVPLQSMNERKI